MSEKPNGSSGSAILGIVFGVGLLLLATYGIFSGISSIVISSPGIDSSSGVALGVLWIVFFSGVFLGGIYCVVKAARSHQDEARGFPIETRTMTGSKKPSGDNASGKKNDLRSDGSEG